MKKWLPLIGWTLLAMSIYYAIEVVFNAGFRQLIQRAGTEKYSQYILIANLLLKIVTLLVFGVWYWVWEHKWSYRPDYRGIFSVKNILCLVGIGLLGQYAVSFLMALVRMVIPSIFANYDRIVQAVSLNQGSPVLMLVLVVVLGPIAEEVLFRGVIYGKLREGFTVTQAAVISGAIFGIYHKNIVQGIYAALFGMILAYIFEKTQTIWGAIGTHTMFNLSSYLLSWLRSLLPALPPLFFLIFDVCCIAVVVAAVLTLRKLPNRYENKMNI